MELSFLTLLWFDFEGPLVLVWDLEKACPALCEVMPARWLFTTHYWW